MNVPLAVVRAATAATTLDPRRTRKVMRTRTRGVTTTLATTWPFTRRTETPAVGRAGFGTTTGVGVGVGVGVGAGDGGGDGVGGGGEDGGGAGAVTVSTWVTGAWPESVADTVGVPSAVSE